MSSTIVTNPPSPPTPASSGTSPGRPRGPCRRTTLAAVAAASLIAGCGSGGGDLPPTSPVGSVSGQYAQQCSPDNPYRQDSDAGPNPAPGTLAIEKQWVREYVNEAYLWYSQVPSVDAGAPAYSNATAAGHFGSLDAYFLALTNTPDDRFSFIYPTRAWNEFSQAGVTLSYGAEFAIQGSGAAAAYRIAFVEPGGPAEVAGLRRGDTLVAIDGTPLGNLSNAAIDAALLPDSAVTYDFTFSRAGVGNVVARLTAGAIVTSPVIGTQILDTPTGRVGYIRFNQHILTAENALVGAVQGLAAQGVNDLVLDMRYNRGGYVYIASQLGYMVAGSNRTAAKVFERQQYNDKRIAESNSTDSIIPFFATKCVPDPSRNFSCTSNEGLPALNLSRVWMLTGPDTCSASESLINGLRGIDVQVNLIGATTCGKPYGFFPKDNCGISYFPIETQGVNAKGFGDYAGGFAATCTVADDFDRALGDPDEAMLAVALGHRASGACVPLGATKATSGAVSKLLPRLERTLKISQPLSGMAR
jgi:C-terminal processing protease CtpA/Prc